MRVGKVALRKRKSFSSEIITNESKKSARVKFKDQERKNTV
jgi:hypothetical protein